ncbi:MAG TPA: toprim domain-containing protein, partial [Bacteroidetes bacterium]|nr:toprim domain-containing protein [Bacteroidota bacterium]
MNLVVVESPSKARTIKKFLGPDFKVSASLGHIKDLPQKELGVDLLNGFAPQYRLISGKKKVVDEIRKDAEKAQQVYIATDPDREGEAIAAHIAESIANFHPSPHRVLFYEITRNSVRQAIENPGIIDKNKVDAQVARRIVDRLVGYKVSPFIWKTVAKGLSAGRVQSVALRLVCERET